MSISALTLEAVGSAQAGIPFALDQQSFLQDASETLLLVGWVIHPHFPVQRVVIGQGEQVLAGVAPGKHRPLAYKKYALLPGADRAGFELTCPSPRPGRYWLGATGPGGQTVRLMEFQLVYRQREQLFYMHIAKAGGSTVNRFLQKQFAPQQALVHIESKEEWLNDPMSLRRYELLTGHVGLEALDRRLDLDGFRLVTVVRQPFAQLRSHLAWIRRLAEPGEEARFNNHPPYVQVFARKLAACDFCSAASIRSLIASLGHEERGLVDNVQVRYFAAMAGDWVSDTELQAAIRATTRFWHIGVAEDIDGFCKAVAAGMGWPEPAPAGRENATPRFFGLEHADEHIEAALEPLMKFDQRLYDHICRQRAEQS